MDEVGHVVLFAPAEQRDLDVGAEADGGVGRALLLEAALEIALGGPDAVERGERGPGARAVEAGDLDVDEREPRLWDERALELGRAAKERDLVAAVAKLLGERERGVDALSYADTRSRSAAESESLKRAPRRIPCFQLRRRAGRCVFCADGTVFELGIGDSARRKATQGWKSGFLRGVGQHRAER